MNNVIGITSTINIPEISGVKFEVLARMLINTKKVSDVKYSKQLVELHSGKLTTSKLKFKGDSITVSAGTNALWLVISGAPGYISYGIWKSQSGIILHPIVVFLAVMIFMSIGQFAFLFLSKSARMAEVDTLIGWLRELYSDRGAIENEEKKLSAEIVKRHAELKR